MVEGRVLWEISLKAFIPFWGAGVVTWPSCLSEIPLPKSTTLRDKIGQMTLRGRYKYSDRYRGKLTSGGNVTGSESIVENRLENQVIHSWEKLRIYRIWGGLLRMQYCKVQSKYYSVQPVMWRARLRKLLNNKSEWGEAAAAGSDSKRSSRKENLKNREATSA